MTRQQFVWMSRGFVAFYIVAGLWFFLHGLDTGHIRFFVVAALAPVFVGFQEWNEQKVLRQWDRQDGITTKRVDADGAIDADGRWS